MTDKVPDQVLICVIDTLNNEIKSLQFDDKLQDILNILINIAYTCKYYHSVVLSKNYSEMVGILFVINTYNILNRKLKNKEYSPFLFWLIKLNYMINTAKYYSIILNLHQNMLYWVNIVLLSQIIVYLGCSSQILSWLISIILSNIIFTKYKFKIIEYINIYIKKIELYISRYIVMKIMKVPNIYFKYLDKNKLNECSHKSLCIIYSKPHFNI
jgi:hypothetical protein